ncbi:hypothetical protein BH11ARM2_BH11ARM2_39060 [soil metagenome]
MTLGNIRLYSKDAWKVWKGGWIIGHREHTQSSETVYQNTLP